MAGYVHVRSRRQLRLSSLDDEVSADSLARAVDLFVRAADLRALGFLHAAAGDVVSVGRPSFDPAAMAGLLLYGCLEGVRSSRRLAKECERNVEVKWLMRDVRPCFKTIANFRRENGAALVELNRAFARFCVAQGLAGAKEVAVDGSKFQSAAGVKAAYNEARIARELAAGDKAAREAAAYLAAVEAADVEDEAVLPSAEEAAAESARVKAAVAKLEALAARRGELDAMSAKLRRSGAKYCVKGDADARVMRKRGGGRMPAYNVQAAVDTGSKFIVHVDVTNAANDRAQLEAQAKAAKDALGVDELTVLADAGYRNAAQTHACEGAGIAVVVPAHRVVNPKGKRFTRDAFTYDAVRDVYTCPAGETLTLRRTDAKLKVRQYQAAVSACKSCALKGQCTASARRTVNRHVHADAQERANERAAQDGELMRRRAASVEQSFANLKRGLGGIGRLSTRGLANVRAEIGLSVLAYNLRRAINLLGAQTLCTMLAAGPMPTPAAAPCAAPP